MDDGAVNEAFAKAWDELNVGDLDPVGWTGSVWRWRLPYRAAGLMFIASAILRFRTDGLTSVAWALFGIQMLKFPTDVRRAYNEGAFESCKTMVRLMFSRRRDDQR